MKIDELDLKLVRALEWDGRAVVDGRLAGLDLAPVAAEARLSRLTNEGLVRGFVLSLFVPPLVGGEWAWAAAFISSGGEVDRSPLRDSPLVRVTEAIVNRSLPRGVGPDLVLLFYTQNLNAAAQFIGRLPGVRHVEVFQVSGHAFPVATALSNDEWRLVKMLSGAPLEDPARLAGRVGQDESWVRAKLDRLLWRADNQKGAVFVLPELCWRTADNFLHVHFALETKLRAEDFKVRVADKGIAVVPYGELFAGKYLQVEKDLWSFAELMAVHEVLRGLPDVEVAGMVWCEENRIERDWVADLIAEKTD